MARTTVAHDRGKKVVVVSAAGVELLEYHYAPEFPAMESVKPYLHPLRTLARDVVTGFRPHDHLWHKGVQMTCAHLREEGQDVGENFWGGPTFVKGKYVQMDNVGSQRHEGWDKIESTGDSALLAQRLTWMTAKAEAWVAERREMTVGAVNETEGHYAIDWHIVLKNVHSKRLWFGSPTTAGRPAAGYGGLFWRGPREFLNGKVLAGNGLEGPGIMGQRAPWLAYQGTHDGTANHTTLVFLDRPGNPDYPNKWFVRVEPMVMAAFSFSFDREVPLESGEAMTLNHRIVLANGTWGRERIEQYLRAANLHD